MKDVKEKAIKKMEEPEMTRAGKEYVPATDIYEKDDSILIRFDMPGVAQGDVDIHLDNTELEISAVQQSFRPEGMDLIMGEYETGVFRRKFTIPQLIDREKIKAHLHNGVLDLELPKVEQAKPRKIEVTSAG